MSYRKQLCARLSEPLASEIMALHCEAADRLEEIRVRQSCKVELAFDGERRFFPFVPDCRQMSDLLWALTGQARYAFERQLANGYLTIPGGHRVGVCGRMTMDENMDGHMTGITSVCIRVARRVDGASCAIRRFLLDDAGRPRRVLLLGAPGSGKTTALRDAAIWLAGERSLHVAVADEREELFPDGLSQGAALDVLRGTEKSRALMQLLRSMAPQVLITDEIGTQADADAIEEAARCGAGILASAHAASIDEAMSRKTLSMLMDSGVMDCAVLIGRHASCLGVWKAI